MRGARRGSPVQLRPRQRAPRVLSACESKALYGTEEEARWTLLLFPELARDGVRPYCCPDCALWHLGHERRRAR